MNRPPPPPSENKSGHAIFVAIGILASRLVGFFRQRCMNHYFGSHSSAADAFYAAFKIPNLLQNLFGEGALSGSFIPVYSRLIAAGEHEKARVVASSILGLLAAAISLLVLLGVLFTATFIDVISPGFTGERRELTITLVRILFPGTGILVLSAWCLGILNSHRRFLLSYSAPVIWNMSIIGALIYQGIEGGSSQLAITVAWGAVVGSIAQFAIQLPSVLRVGQSVTPSLRTDIPEVRSIVQNFIPTTATRGLAQISAYIDQMIVSLLPIGAVTGLANAQLIYTLPVSLFGMSISASELPELSRLACDSKSLASNVKQRLDRSIRYICFNVVPCSFFFIFFGDVLARGVYQTGAFKAEDALYVWYILAGSTIGLLAGTTGRLLSSTLYALQDAKTPLRLALLRMTLASGLGFVAATFIPSWLGVDQSMGVVGITASSGLCSWIECLCLQQALRRRLQISLQPPPSHLIKLVTSALIATLVCYPLKAKQIVHPTITAGIIGSVYSVIFLIITICLGVTEGRAMVNRIIRRIR